MGTAWLTVLRFLPRAVACLVWILAGLLTIALTYSLGGLAYRLWTKKYWSWILLWICGVRVSTRGAPRLDGPVLWVVNHVSWIDIFVLNGVRSTAFVAKSEIRSWPLIGWLAAGAGTLFIERASRHAVHKVGQSIEQHFDRGQSVGLFPEGTTSPGFDVLPFYANLFESARKSGTAIQPVALRYYHHGVRSDFAAYVGDETLIRNLWRVLGGVGVSIELVFLPVIWGAEGTTGEVPPPRALLGRMARDAIRAVLVT